MWTSPAFYLSDVEEPYLVKKVYVSSLIVQICFTVIYYKGSVSMKDYVIKLVSDLYWKMLIQAMKEIVYSNNIDEKTKERVKQLLKGVNE
jgi:hypothetical protein